MNYTDIILLTVVATVLIIGGAWRLRAKIDRAEPKLWTDIAEEAIRMAEKDALEKDQEAKVAAAAAADAHARIAAFRGRLGGPAA